MCVCTRLRSVSPAGISEVYEGRGSADVSPSQSVQVGTQQSRVTGWRAQTSDQHGPILSLPMALFQV